MKQGQVSTYVIIGIFLVIVAALVISVRFSADTKIDSAAQKIDSAQDVITAMDTYVKECVEDTVIKGLELNGIDQDLVDSYVDAQVPGCVEAGLQTYRSIGYTVSSTFKSASVQISDDAINVEINYPITVDGQDSSSEKEYFFSNFPRKIVGRLEHDGSCRVTKDTGIISFDKKVSLLVPAGTTATDSAGNCLDQLELSLEDPVSEVVTFGPIAYNAGPNGAQFSPYVEYSYRFTDQELQDFVTRGGEDLRLAYYDPVERTHRAYPDGPAPLMNIIDSNKKEILARVTHFTITIAAENCQQGSSVHYVSDVVTVPKCSADPCPDGEKEFTGTYSYSIAEDDSCSLPSTGVVFLGTSPTAISCNPAAGADLSESAGTHSVTCIFERKVGADYYANSRFRIEGVGGTLSRGPGVHDFGPSPDFGGNFPTYSVNVLDANGQVIGTLTSGSGNIMTSAGCTWSNSGRSWICDADQKVFSSGDQSGCVNHCAAATAAASSSSGSSSSSSAGSSSSGSSSSGSSSSPTQCSDGTLYGSCAANKPFYCDPSGSLVEKCNLCNCPTSTYACQSDGSCVLKCSADGTLDGFCSSSNIPKFCSDGNLIDRCSTCGCPAGLVCQPDETCISTCSDGTLEGQCSATKPFACSSGTLTESCESCGCSSGFWCNNTTQKCVAVCSNGIINGTCDPVSVPNYCVEGVWEQRCDICGCQTGVQCCDSVSPSNPKYLTCGC
ncbi:MAG TPA: hypothetical protein VJH97_06910 [Candidatus Nanoarchaeia archaeon]|nr:hypothetical protein [Candidatus Nanoarchaeia archaeon]